MLHMKSVCIPWSCIFLPPPDQFCSSHTLQEVYIDLFEKLDEALAASLQKSCDTYETGIEIVAIRVTKPRIPEAVKRNYEAIETAKTEFLVQKEREKVAKAEENINLLRATMSAQRGQYHLLHSFNCLRCRRSHHPSQTRRECIAHQH